MPGLVSALSQSVAPSTLKSYFSCFKKWKRWCSQFPEVKYFPASETYLGLYLVQLLQSGYSFTSIQSTLYAIGFFHKSCGLQNPCDSKFLKAVAQGCKRLDCKSNSVSRQKSPILPEHLSSLVSRFAGPRASLSDIRDVTLCLVGFAGFFRFNELCNIKWSDISFADEFFSVTIPRSKTDQYHNGSTVLIAKTGFPTCPYSMLVRYASSARADMTSNNFVFGKLIFHSSTKTYSLREGSQLSYSRAREVVLSKFSTIGLDQTNFGLHSLRIGGASAAANNDIPDRAIKKHGRWKSERSKDLYCRENLKHKLLVSLNLGI